MEDIKKKTSMFFSDEFRQLTKIFLQKTTYTILSKVSGGKEKALLWSYGQSELSPFILLQGHLKGSYPLPNKNNPEFIEWHDPEVRGIIPLDNFKIQKDLWRKLKKEKLKAESERFEIRINTNFNAAIRGCAAPRGGKTKTWITPEYIEVATELHRMGHVHSIETYINNNLVGGVIGIAINGFFDSLSLFHTVDNASKVAYYYLLVKLREDGFKLIASGPNPWFSQYGMVYVEKTAFRKELINAITAPVSFSNRVPVIDF
ncbi:leucyl/phenylalanyl-tRNA--protein transferase [Pedobacter sp.]|uniref:leucyl/phenylalanyl-tRNA--protein transferase n=1 Tax=Pedobacter sp. TaxID=1411316 RepID=UPI003D7F4675